MITIYEILIEDKVEYIGTTSRPLYFRLAEHKSKKTHIGQTLNKASNYVIKPLDYAPTKEEAKQLEAYWISKKNTLYPNGCNRTASGGAGLGRCEETLKLMSEAHKGQQPWLGKTQTDETKKKIGLSKLGKKMGPQSEEHKRKKAEARRAFYARKREEVA
jgi:group I intron endonuclease